MSVQKKALLACVLAALAISLSGVNSEAAVMDDFSREYTSRYVTTRQWGDEGSPAIKIDTVRKMARIEFARGAATSIHNVLRSPALLQGEVFQMRFDHNEAPTSSVGMLLTQIQSFVGFGFRGFVFERNTTGKLVLTIVKDGTVNSPEAVADVTLPEIFWLQIARTGVSSFSFSYSVDGINFLPFATHADPDFNDVQFMGFGGWAGNGTAPVVMFADDMEVKMLAGAAITVNAKDVASSSEAAAMNPGLVKLEKRFLDSPAVWLNANIAKFDSLPAKVRMELFFQQFARKRIPIQTIVTLPEPGDLEVISEFSLAGKPFGHYVVVIDIIDGSGNVTATLEQPFLYPAPPLWLGSSAGKSTEVPAPWTPLEKRPSPTSDSVEVGVWGRDVRFGALALPDRIMSQGKSLLASPIAFVATDGSGKPLSIEAGAVHLDHFAADAATIRGTARLGSAEIEVISTIEFDGCIRVDATIDPKNGPLELSGLVLEIPVADAPDFLRYLMPKEYGGQFIENPPTWAGLVPDAGLDFEFPYLLWLGNANVGLHFFAETEKGLQNSKLDTAGQLRRQGNTTVLRVSLVDHAIAIDQPWKFTFGLLPSPSKPYPKDWQKDYRVQGHFYDFLQQYRQQDGLTGFQPLLEDSIVEYEIDNQLSLSEGQISLDVKPGFDPANASPQSIFSVRVNPTGPMRFTQEALAELLWDPARGLVFETDAEHGTEPLLGKWTPQPNTWQRVTLKWGKQLEIHVDGKTVASRSQDGLLQGEPVSVEKGFLALGFLPAARQFHWVIDNLEFTSNGTTLKDTFDKPFAANGWHLTEAGGRVHADASWEAGVADKGLKTFFDKEGVTYLDRVKEWGAETIVFHEYWTSACGHYATEHTDKLHELVKACHDRGLKLLLYFGCQFPTVMPEYVSSGAEFALQRPGEEYRYFQLFDNSSLIPCWGYQPMEDYIAAATEYAMKSYDIDGVYLDGIFMPEPCENELHGHGYIGTDGIKRGTVPWFAFRQVARRVQHVVHSHKPDGIVDAHVPAYGPIAVYADRAWTGETPAAWAEKNSLDLLRVLYAGRHFGIPAEILLYSGQGYMPGHSMALQLLLGTPVKRGWYATSHTAEQATPMNVLKAFGYADAEWLPYWDEKNPYYAANLPKDVHISLYRKSGEGSIMIVANLGAEIQQFSVGEQISQLGTSSAAPVVMDALTGESFNAQEAISVKAKNFRMLWVK